MVSHTRLSLVESGRHPSRHLHRSWEWRPGCRPEVGAFVDVLMGEVTRRRDDWLFSWPIPAVPCEQEGLWPSLLIPACQCSVGVVGYRVGEALLACGPI